MKRTKQSKLVFFIVPFLAVFVGVFYAIGDIFAAGDTSQSWDFANSGDYILSDSSKIEISNNSARLKVQNYAADSNTKALFHFDESSGTASDSSDNSNTATLTNGSYVTGRLNNGVSFSGNNSYGTVSDSSSLSFTGQNTIETWFKPASDVSSTSNSADLGIVDKGAYKMYIDHNTGKITYELANASATSWTKRAGNSLSGSWDLNGKLAISSATTLGSDAYYGLGNAVGDAEVWKWDGTTWTMIGGDALNNSWATDTFEEVLSLTSDATYVYAGLGTGAGEGEVWRWNGTTWTKIGGDTTNSSWASNTYEGVYSMAVVGSTVYAGLGASTLDAEVWSWNGTSWTKIGGDGINTSWNTSYELVSSLVGDGTNLYAGLGNTAGDAEVWRWNGTAWTRIGGDTVNSSWDSTSFEYVLSNMVYYGSNLYVGLGTSANDAEVWRWNGTSWTKIGGDSLNSGWTTNYEAVYSLATDGTNLYAGLGNTAGDNEVWRWNGTAWTKIGGDAINSGFTNTHTYVRGMVYLSGNLLAGLTSTGASSQVWSWNGTAWTLIGGNYDNNSWGFFNLQNVTQLTSWNNKLYAGTGNTVAGNGLVFEYDGTNWTLIGGQAINSSWAFNTFEIVTSMVGFGGNLYVGLGNTPAGDGEVWKWNGTVWSKIGGDGVNSSWNVSYEIVSALGVQGSTLYAGLGNSAGDAEVYSWNGTTWTKIGGDSLNSSFNNTIEIINTIVSYNNNLYVGLGNSAGDGDVWRWNGSTWSQVGGDGLNSSWPAATIEEVNVLRVFNGKLYAGLGNSTDDAEIWEYNGSGWTKIADGGLGFATGDYERVNSLAGYNGELYVGLGSAAGDGDVWKWDGSTWTQVGGDTLNSSWPINATETVRTLAVYNGKLYAGLGDSANFDAAVWSLGNNTVLKSATSSFSSSSWYHVAATYDGATAKIYINGVEDNSTSASVTMPDSSNNLLIGTQYSGYTEGKGLSYFNGILDELRISNSARTSFNTTPYSTDPQTVTNAAAVFTQDIASYAGFLVTNSGGGSVNFRLSSDGGTTWKYWNGSSWSTSSSISDTSSIADINTNIADFPITTSGIIWQAVLDGDGTEQVTVSGVTVEANSDVTDPSPPDTLTALSAPAGSVIVSNTWYSHTTPYFSWSGATDAGAGVAGYYVYFGTDPTAIPLTAAPASFQAGTSYTASGLTSGQTYYLRIQAKDNAQNISSVYQAFIYKIDNDVPINPSLITVTPSGYSSSNNFTFAWPETGDGIASDASSGVAGYQYKTGASSGDLSNWSTTITDTVINIPDAAYQTDANTFYLRTIDNTGNIAASTLQVNYYFAGSGPTAPQFLTVNPSTNTTNSFSFAWQAPDSYSGSASEITYCYTVNSLPSLSSCNYTSAGATAISAGPFATQLGLNTFYVAAKNPVSSGGAINYAAYSSVVFTANTSSPGIPLGLEISDVSIKSQEAWRLALSWDTPTDIGSGVSEYQIYRSEDDITYTLLASTSGLAYIDTNLESQIYYYKVKACDSVENCGVGTTAVSLLPTGRFTEAASLQDEPTVTNVTTKQATVNWSTDRVSDSKIQYGTSGGNYFDEEPSNSDQVTAHEISLNNLKPGTSYYALAKWTDEDGNTGVSDEFTFETEPAPTVTDPKISSVGINSVSIEYTVKGASKVKIYYGLTSAFGGSVVLSTSASETKYVTTINELTDGTKYFYKINSFDTEDEEYEGNILSFETLPKPKISNVRIQQVKGTAQPSVLISWTTNTEVSTILTYYPKDNQGLAKDEITVDLVKEHRVLLRGLSPETIYSLIAGGRDKAGNEALSDPQTFTTSTDTRPPVISALKVEGAIQKGAGDTSLAQLVVTWNTDEPSSSQLEYGEGTGSSYSQKTQEDTNLTSNHLVVISGLSPSKVYHLRVLSKDKANNLVKSVDTVTITPKSSNSALDLVVSNLKETFGFIGGIQL